MYLKQLEISGFKSFAARTVLELEPGITAIVGPNGSGKSNIADALRWTLGEQSVKSLRLKKSEELVFAGTDKRPKASLAEVKLLLDNQQGRMPLGFSEIELSRLLYRNGDSEYRLNGNKAKLNELQQLLIQAGFGPNSYSVIGQGMIDSLILAAPAERKLLFDEASGIREFELKKADTQRKLEATEANLERLRDILGELAPRLKNLERAVEAVSSRQAVEAELAQCRGSYVATLTKQISVYKSKLTELDGALKAMSAQAEKLESERQKLEVAATRSSQERAKRADELQNLEAKRDEIMSRLSVCRAELAVRLDKAVEQDLARELKRLQRQLESGQAKYERLKEALEKAMAVENQRTAELESITHEISKAQSQLSRIRRQNDQSSQFEYTRHALSLLKHLSQGLTTGSMGQEQMKLMVYKVGRLLKLAIQGQGDVLDQLKTMQLQITSLMRQREEMHDNYTKAVIKVRSLELDLAHLDKSQGTLAAQIEQTKAKQQEQPEAGASTALKQRQAAELEVELEALDAQLGRVRQQIAEPEGSDNTRIFALARELEAIQSGLNQTRQTQQEYAKLLEDDGQKLADQNKLIPIKAEPSKMPLDEQERNIALLEGRLLAAAGEAGGSLDEYQEVKERYSFLGEQVSDLELAKTDLVKLLKQFDELIKSRFKEAFSDISKHFSKTFEQLFGGGRAALRLDVDAAGNYGIEISAVPPGKRTNGLTQLSGGERALTGIALLSAILQRNPSPFVVLDEVDAALDEANSTRFATVLKQLGGHCQILVITHNRQTMQAANCLYGVTMDEHHVSRLLSLRLDEARELAQQTS
jgi:chromosome segregation ATPase